MQHGSQWRRIFLRILSRIFERVSALRHRSGIPRRGPRFDAGRKIATRQVERASQLAQGHCSHEQAGTVRTSEVHAKLAHRSHTAACKSLRLAAIETGR